MLVAKGFPAPLRGLSLRSSLWFLTDLHRTYFSIYMGNNGFTQISSMSIQYSKFILFFSLFVFIILFSNNEKPSSHYHQSVYVFDESLFVTPIFPLLPPSRQANALPGRVLPPPLDPCHQGVKILLARPRSDILTKPPPWADSFLTRVSLQHPNQVTLLREYLFSYTNALSSHCSDSDTLQQVTLLHRGFPPFT